LTIPFRPTPMLHPFRILIALGFLAVAVGGCAERPAAVIGKPEPDPDTAPADPAAPFTFTDQNGEPFSSEQLAGKVWLGAIFFANCPGPCFRENQAIAEILRDIDDPDFLVVSLTCDPANDTPEVLRRYADRFDANKDRWKFLTGDLKEIVRVGTQRLKLPVELGVHAEKGVVFDRQGKLRGGYSLTDPDRAKLLAGLIREVLAEGPAAGDEEGP
jgi:cytochrome oxidase Cu insertion factor (SCO1/SenC/PrrC family)